MVKAVAHFESDEVSVWSPHNAVIRVEIDFVAVFQ
jgi:hypothetical protein